MRVCVIGLRGLPPVIGGIETHCEQLYPLMAAQDVTLDVVLLTRAGFGSSGEAAPGVRARASWAPGSPGLETFLHTLLAIFIARFSERADLVHLHGIGPGFFAPLARILGLRTIVTHHARDYERPRWGWPGRLILRLGEWATAMAAHGIICVSGALRDEFLNDYPSARRRTYVIRNAGFDATAPMSGGVLDQLGLEAGGYILAVGRLEATKAFDLLMQAYDRAQTRRHKLVIVGGQGDPAYAQYLTRLASDRVVFGGVRSAKALRELYAGAAVFVHASSMEGYGLVVAEALSMGAPVLASSIPQHREFGLEPGCYFPPGDVDALVDRLRVKDFQIYRSEAAEARARADSWSRVAREHQRVYSHVLGAHVARRAGRGFTLRPWRRLRRASSTDPQRSPG